MLWIPALDFYTAFMVAQPPQQLGRRRHTEVLSEPRKGLIPISVPQRRATSRSAHGTGELRNKAQFQLSNNPVPEHTET